MGTCQEASQFMELNTKICTGMLMGTCQEKVAPYTYQLGQLASHNTMQRPLFRPSYAQSIDWHHLSDHINVACPYRLLDQGDVVLATHHCLSFLHDAKMRWINRREEVVGCMPIEEAQGHAADEVSPRAWLWVARYLNIYGVPDLPLRNAQGAKFSFCPTLVLIVIHMCNVQEV
mmetsp:Transcript_92197/g.176811  ORF Transcript_92197/g.176811 Transcript_92197/m.176811 type:complete len:174 (-) Transcript_92197:1012-1533(-)